MSVASLLTTRSFATLLFLTLGIGVGFPATSAGQGSPPSLEEIAQAAHLIFAGTVESRSVRTVDDHRSLFTDVLFADVQVVHATGDSIQWEQDTITLSYAGGQTPEFSLFVSGTPSFVTGKRYLLFVFDDGEAYGSPVIGLDRGQYEIVPDRAGGTEYLLSLTGKAVISVDSGGVGLTRQRVDFIEGGIIHFDTSPPPYEDWYFAEVPVASDPSGSASPSAEIGGEEPDPIPVPLPDFISYVVGEALTAPLSSRVLPPSEGRGTLYRRVGEEVVPEELPPARQRSRSLIHEEPSPLSPGRTFEPKLSNNYDSELLACGYHDLSLVMEQVSTSHPAWGANNAAMVGWNDVMGVFAYVPDDGYYEADNGESEFIGYLTNAETLSGYGFTWGSAVAMTANYYYGDLCDEISESDIMFNAHASWSYDLEYVLAHSGVVLYQRSCRHETGHAWGLQAGTATETYAYDHPTVVNGYGGSVVEDFNGIHVADAYLIRRQYSDQTGIIASWKDVGVESYYGKNGIKASTTDVSNYHPGGSLTVRNLLVENMSYGAVPDVRLRLYLTADRTVTPSDYQIGSWWWAWPSFPGEKYNVSDYTSTVPYEVPAGQYYVGAIATANGFGSDGNPSNNTTTLRHKINIYPGAPANVQASDGTYTDRVRVTWDPVPGAGTYYVYSALSDTVNRTILGSTSGTLYDDMNAIPAFLTYYWVKAVAGGGESLFSSYDTGYKGLTSPLNVQASDGTYTDKVLVTWTGVPGTSQETVWRSTTDSLATAQSIGTSAYVTGAYSDTTAVPEILYYYWIEAEDAGGSSVFSSSDAGWRHLAAPAGVTASDGSRSGRVTVLWSPVPYAASYEVWRGSSIDLAQATNIASAVYGTSYDDTSVIPQSTYYYWVKAINDWGYSDFSSHDTGYAGPVNPLWPNAWDMGGGWKSTWAGILNDTLFPWVFHGTLGWYYCVGDDPDGVWIWHEFLPRNWVWTSRSAYSFMYVPGVTAWYWYLPGSSNPWWFFDFRSMQWVSY